MAEREVSAFEFNFNILRPRACFSVCIVSAPPEEAKLPWLVQRLARAFYPLHQLQQQQQQKQQPGRRRWLRFLEQLLLPPLLPVEGGTSDLPLLHGGVKRLDATLLKLQSSADFGAFDGDAEDAFNAQRLEIATDKYIDEMLQRGGLRGPLVPGLPASDREAEPKELDKRVIKRFLGDWEFDRSRSSSMSPISEHLGVPWLTVRLNLSGADVQAEDEDVGAWSSVTRVEGSVIKTTQKNVRQKALLFETREIKPDGESFESGMCAVAQGPQTDALWYHVTLKKEGLPAEISAVRVFKRVSGPPPGVLLETAHPAERLFLFHLRGLNCDELPPERTVVSECSLSTASSPAKEVAAPAEAHEAAQAQAQPPAQAQAQVEAEVPQPRWKSFLPREKAVSAEMKWVVDHLDDPSVFQKSSCRGYETFKAANYKFRVADGQPVVEGDPLPVMGVGRINLGKMDLQKCIDYLVKPEVKMEFDSSTSKVITILTEDNFSLVYQSFKGQWGFAGRDFVIACWNTKVDENRTILGCESVEWTEPIEGQLEGLVRGTLHLGGYDLQRKENGDVFLCFIAQADLKTTGVPEWINTRVKAEQLTVVKNIRDKLLKL
ncbi:hypothetical protein ACSSS7_003683 [Eimeria intestinalis]